MALPFPDTPFFRDLLVLDAAAPEAGPVATAMLSHRVPHGFHGTWRPAVG